MSERAFAWHQIVVYYIKGLRMLHIWLIPCLVILVAVLLGFYLVVRFKGGSGVRSEGRTLLDKPAPEQDLPPQL